MRRRVPAIAVLAAMLTLAAGAAFAQVPLDVFIEDSSSVCWGQTLEGIPLTWKLYGGDGILKAVRTMTSAGDGSFVVQPLMELEYEILPGDTVEIDVGGEVFRHTLRLVLLRGYRPRNGTVLGSVTPPVDSVYLEIAGARVGATGPESFTAHLEDVPVASDGSFSAAVNGSRRGDMAVIGYTRGAFTITHPCRLPGLQTFIGHSAALVFGDLRSSYRGRLFDRQGTLKGRSAASSTFGFAPGLLRLRRPGGGPAVISPGDALRVRGPQGTYWVRIPPLDVSADPDSDEIVVSTRPLANVNVQVYYFLGQSYYTTTEEHYVQTDLLGSATIRTTGDLLPGDSVLVQLQDERGNWHVRAVDVLPPATLP